MTTVPVFSYQNLQCAKSFFPLCDRIKDKKECFVVNMSLGIKAASKLSLEGSTTSTTASMSTSTTPSSSNSNIPSTSNFAQINDRVSLFVCCDQHFGPLFHQNPKHMAKYLQFLKPGLQLCFLFEIF